MEGKQFIKHINCSAVSYFTGLKSHALHLDQGFDRDPLSQRLFNHLRPDMLLLKIT